MNLRAMILRGTAGRICHLENVKSYMSYLQQCTKIIKMLTLKTCFSLISYILNIKIRPLLTEYALTIKLVGRNCSAQSFNPYAYFGHSWSYFNIQYLQLAIQKRYYIYHYYLSQIPMTYFLWYQMRVQGHQVKGREVIHLEWYQ
jgi:hypothetical protein